MTETPASPSSEVGLVSGTEDSTPLKFHLAIGRIDPNLMPQPRHSPRHIERGLGGSTRALRDGGDDVKDADGELRVKFLSRRHSGIVADRQIEPPAPRPLGSRRPLRGLLTMRPII